MLKYKIYNLMLFLICLFSMGMVKANDFPLIGKVIYLDPGHGGTDPGAVYMGTYEAHINLELSLKLQEELEKQGATVYLTRYGDYDLSVKNAIQRKRSDLSRRANIINRSECDMYLSIHLNADSSTTWRGAQVFYEDVHEQNEKIAAILQKEFVSNLNTNREYKKLVDQYMYKRINIPGVLIEAGFISNDNERYLLKTNDYQKKVAEVITNGIIKYFKG